MTGSEIKTLTESILDGLTLDDDFFYQLLNIAKTNLEELRTWQYLKKLDSSNTAGTGIGYTTGYTLPTDFASSYRVMLGTNTELIQVGFDEQHIYRNSYGYYYIDLANNQFFLLGTIGSSNPIYFFYKKFTDDITSSTSPAFPARFHALLAFHVAGYYQMGVDADDIFARMSPENKVAALTLQKSMTTWDSTLAMKAQDNRVGVANSEPDVPLSRM